jgi:hypothetical protein
MYTVKEVGDSKLVGLYYNNVLICVFVSYKFGASQAKAVAELLNEEEHAAVS